MNWIELHKYTVLTGFVLIVALFIIATEGWDRYAGLLQQYQTTASRAGEAVPPEQLIRRESALQKERGQMKKTNAPNPADSGNNGKAGLAGLAGLIEVITETARTNNLRMITFVPAGEGSHSSNSGLRRTFPFQIVLEGGYNSLGCYVNGMENAPVNFEIQSVVVTEPPSARSLRSKVRAIPLLATITATAVIRNEDKP